MIGPPVSTTSTPRASPSVVSIATARMRSSPRCCCTSHTSTPALAAPMSCASSSARGRGAGDGDRVIDLGQFVGETASITTPWISSMRPTLRLAPLPLAARPAGVGSVAMLASIVSDSPRYLY